jgi:hypothetical protein
MKMLLAVLTPVEESIQEHPNALDREGKERLFVGKKESPKTHAVQAQQR